MIHIDDELMKVFDFKVNELEESKVKEIFFLIKKMLLGLDGEQIKFKNEFKKGFHIETNQSIDENEKKEINNNEEVIREDEKPKEEREVNNHPPAKCGVERLGDESLDSFESLDCFINHIKEMENHQEFCMSENEQCKQALEEIQQQEKIGLFEKLLALQQEMLRKDGVNGTLDISGMIENEMNQFSGFVEPLDEDEDELERNNLLDAFLQQFDAVQITKDKSRIEQKPFVPNLSSSDDSLEFLEPNMDGVTPNEFTIETPTFTIPKRKRKEWVESKEFDLKGGTNTYSFNSKSNDLLEIKLYNERNWVSISEIVEDTLV